MNLLNNLPVSCLDVLIDLPVLGGDENYSGKNMDAVQKLLDFMEKRVDKVKFFPFATPAQTIDRCVDPLELTGNSRTCKALDPLVKCSSKAYK